MTTFTAGARQELLSSRRERMPQVLLAVFVGMVTASSVIGWLTNQVVTSVYDRTFAAGLTTQPNPFSAVSPLYYAKNTVIYIILIGALLAIVLGVQSTIRDRKAHTFDLVLSRPVRPASYLGAKLAGLLCWVAGILALSALISWTSISAIVGSVLSPGDTARLLGFYALAWLFLLPFIILGMLTGVYSRRETTALLVPIVIWSVVTFVVPQLGTAAHPVSLLNPVPAIASQGGVFQLANLVLGPLSLTEHFKQASAFVLGDTATTGSPLLSLVVMVAFAGCMLVVLLTTQRDRMRSPLDE
ncbi:ABC transporter permease [Cryobacterium sp. PH31-AA6]|uniref:ABC transporter permease n=1 Tax=Cryobacterium sp. PH31-AA6 TaxID=3046205 RepID=UPI0024B9886A|nr:ABC transporter permease [Cryobacterium sp. PH31-AA6]MDJ0322642.1 ABC transporter permease [Cryobacterium sp. PH31-AA6]